MSITTLEGNAVTSMVTGGVKINGANVVNADIEASNGVVHVIDTVLLPPQPKIAEIATADPRFSTLVAALT